MAVNERFESFKETVGGVRSDSAPSTSDGDSIAVRVNEYGELMVTGGEGSTGGVEDKAYDSSTGSNLVTPTITDADRYVPAELAADETNLSADTYYYPTSAGVTLGEYDHITIQIVTASNATLTFEATLDEVSWIDITESGYSLLNGTDSAVSYVDQTDIIDFERLNVENLRVKVVATGGGTDVKIHIRRRKA